MRDSLPLKGGGLGWGSADSRFLPHGKVALPRREALDLVAYLQTLKQE